MLVSDAGKEKSQNPPEEMALTLLIFDHFCCDVHFLYDHDKIRRQQIRAAAARDDEFLGKSRAREG